MSQSNNSTNSRRNDDKIKQFLFEISTAVKTDSEDSIKKVTQNGKYLVT